MRRGWNQQGMLYGTSTSAGALRAARALPIERLLITCAQA